jgi:hypothetical protein
MKNFKDYITGKKKTYDFKIKVAGELPAKFESVLKTALEKFSVDSFKKSKTPVQKNPLDFPNLENQEVHIFEICLNYPVIPPILREYISEKTSVVEAMIIVRGAHEPEEEYQMYDGTDKKYAAKLTSEYDKEEDNHELVGEKRVFNLFKELSAMRKEEKDSKQSPLKIEPHKSEKVDSVIGSKKMPPAKGTI